MKYLILTLLLVSPAAHASWFWPSDPVPEYRAKITSMETQLSAQRGATNLWQIASGSLAVGCVVLLVIGTALGAKTRTHYHAEQRMGSTPPIPGTNGRKSNIVGKKAEDNTHETLAA